MRRLVFLIIAVLLAIPAYSDTVSEVRSFDSVGTSNLTIPTSGKAVLRFNGFDASLGTLTGIRYSFSGTITDTQLIYFREWGNTTSVSSVGTITLYSGKAPLPLTSLWSNQVYTNENSATSDQGTRAYYFKFAPATYTFTTTGSIAPVAGPLDFTESTVVVASPCVVLSDSQQFDNYRYDNTLTNSQLTIYYDYTPNVGFLPGTASFVMVTIGFVGIAISRIFTMGI